MLHHSSDNAAVGSPLSPSDGKPLSAEETFDRVGETGLMLPDPTLPPPAQNASFRTPEPSPEDRYTESETSTVFRKDSDMSQLLGFQHRKDSEPSGLSAGPALPMAGYNLGPAIINGSVANSPPKRSPLSHPSAPSGPTEGRLNALVVDDDKMTRMLMSRMLTRIGHDVTTAENGSIALDMLRSRHLARHQQQQEVKSGQEEIQEDEGKKKVDAEKQFDIVFLDNQMPVMTGVEAVRDLRRIGCNVFVVGATGNGEIIGSCVLFHRLSVHSD